MVILPHLKRVVLGLAPLLFAGLTGCSRTERPIYIGVAGALSDPIGEPMRRAAQLAVGEVNARGGVRGRPLVLIERDDFANPDSAVRVAEELYASEAVGVVGHLFSGTTLAAAPIYNGGSRPLVAVTPSSSAPEVSDAGPFTFRICPSDLAHGAALARWVTDRLQLKQGAVFYLDDDYGRGIRQAFSNSLKERGGRLVGTEPYLGTSPDVGPQLERLAKLQRPQFLFVAGNRPDAESILRGARALNLQVPMLGGDGLEGIEEAGPLAEGTYVSAAYHPSLNTTANRKFIAAYAAKYPDTPVPNQPAAATYDAVHLLARAIAEGGASREGVRRAMDRVGRGAAPFEGATGKIAFDSLGDVPDKQVFITVVRNGAVLLAGGL
jgi:branched-chain amino acid transport system substrate-binding protein